MIDRVRLSFPDAPAGLVWGHDRVPLTTSYTASWSGDERWAATTTTGVLT